MAALHLEVMTELLVAVRFAAETKSALIHFHYAMKDERLKHQVKGWILSQKAR